MTSNVSFQTDQRAWPPDGLVIETEEEDEIVMLANMQFFPQYEQVTA